MFQISCWLAPDLSSRTNVYRRTFLAGQALVSTNSCGSSPVVLTKNGSLEITTSDVKPTGYGYRIGLAQLAEP